MRNRLKRALRSPLRVALNPCLAVARRHGSVWFQVSGFGLVKRDFLTTDPDLLIEYPKRLAMDVARQIILIDPTLPKREVLCQPVQIDIVTTALRRLYALPTFRLLLEQAL